MKAPDHPLWNDWGNGVADQPRRHSYWQDEAQSILRFAYWFGLLIALPLAFDPFALWGLKTTEYVLLWPKASVLALSVCVGLLAIRVGWGRSSGVLRRLSRQYLVLVVLAGSYAVSMIVSAVLDIVINGAAWPIVLLGGSARLDGVLFRVLWVLVLFIAATLMTTSTPSERRAITIMLVTGGLIVGTWATLEVYGFEPYSLVDGSIRSLGVGISTLGHRAFATTYVGMVLAVLYSLQAFSGRIKLVGGASTVILSGALVATGGRAGFAGLLLALIVASSIAFRSRSLRHTLVLLAGLVALGGAVAAFTTTSGRLQSKTLLAAAQGDDGSFSMRTDYFWPIAIRGIAERPLTGWGLDGFSDLFWARSTPEEQLAVVKGHLGMYEEVVITGTTFQLVRSPGEDEFKWVLFDVDRAHNLYLDVAVSFGLITLVLLCAVLGLVSIAVIRHRVAAGIAFVLGASVYFVFGLAWFDVPQIAPTAWLLLGVAFGMSLIEPAGQGNRLAELK